MFKKNLAISSILFLAILQSLSMNFTSTSYADKLEKFEMTARVMYVDLDNDMINIAEMEINLLSHIETGIKIWDTLFIDNDGNQIDPSQFMRRDKVHVLGKSSNGRISADKIMRLEPER